MPTAFLPRRAPVSSRPHERSGADRTQPRRPVPPDALGTDGIQRPKPKPCRSSPPLGNSVSSLPRGRTRSGRASGPGHRCPVPPNAQGLPRGRPCPGHPEPKNQNKFPPGLPPKQCCLRPRGRACLWVLAARAHLPAGRAPSCSNHPSWTAGCVRKSLPNSHGHRGRPCPRRRTWKSRGRPLGARLSINFHSNPAPPPSTGRRSANQLMGV